MDKSPDAFRTISEVAELLETPAHVLRFWESRFPQIKPVKRAGGRRYYRPADLALLTGIRRLLHEEGLTIRGVQKILREQGVRHVSGLADDDVDLDVGDDDMEHAPERANAPIALFPTARGPEVPQKAADATQDLDPVAEASREGDAELADIVAEIAADEGIDEAALYAAIEGTVEVVGAAADVPEADDIGAVDADTPVTADDEIPADAMEVEDDLQTNLFAAQDSDGDIEGGAGDTAKAVPDVEKTVAAVAEATPDTATAAPKPDRKPLPDPMPAVTEITGHWLAADLRGLRAGALGEQRPQAAALFKRLEALRNRVGDLGRVPRR